jgi:hypothetical protein
MSAPFKGLLEGALEQAVQQQFCQLFAVLFVKPDEAAYKRFHAGIARLGDMERTVGVYIAELP